MTSIVPEKEPKQEIDEAVSQGMHIEGENPMKAVNEPDGENNDADAVVDVDEIERSQIEISPEQLESGVYDDESIPLEDGYGDGDPVV